MLTRACHWYLSWTGQIESPSNFFQIYFNIIHVHPCLQSGLSFRFFQLKPSICISVCWHTCHIPCQSHPHRFYHYDNTWRRVWTTMMQCSAAFCHMLLKFHPYISKTIFALHLNCRFRVGNYMQILDCWTIPICIVIWHYFHFSIIHDTGAVRVKLVYIIWNLIQMVCLFRHALFGATSRM
jgi:hypothetical protein